MATEYYVDGPGNYLGAWPEGHSGIPGGSTEVGSAPPINDTQVWGFPNWGAIVPDTDSMAYDQKSSKNSGVIGELNVFGWNSALSESAYSKTSTVIVDNTAGSEDGSLKFETCQNGALVEVLTLEKGVTLNGATGGDQGLGSVNSTAYHINGGPAIESGATADQTGAEIKTAYEAESNAYTDTKDTKLGGIEALADVTDAVNVASAGAALLSAANEYTKTQNFNATTLTDGVNISWDLESNQVTSVILEGNRTLDNPTNLIDGATYIITVKQDGTGTRTLAYGSVYKFPGGTAPTLSTGANDVDIISFVSDGTNMYGVFQGDFS